MDRGLPPSRFPTKNPCPWKGAGAGANRGFGLLGVGDAPVGEGAAAFAHEFLAAGVVVLAAVGQFNAGLRSGWSCCMGMASIEKCSHWMFLEEIQVPVPWLGASAPPQEGVNVL